MEPISRRRFHRLAVAAVGAAPAFGVWTFPNRSFAEELAQTPALTEGPFYPDKLPLDTDNDLLIVGPNTTKAIGEVTHLTGKIVGLDGKPLSQALIEIWQVDANGRYLHSRDAARGGSDANFQGYGRFLTGTDGSYYFRTVKPVPYPGRTPHIHFAVSQGGRRFLTSQIFIAGVAQNERDGVYNSLRLATDREHVTTEFKPVAESAIGELAAQFDIVLGKTPVEGRDGAMRPPGGPGGPGRPPGPGGPDGFGPPPRGPRPAG